MKNKRIYRIVSIGKLCEIDFTTYKKRELNNTIKYLAKYGTEQKTYIEELPPSPSPSHGT